MNYLTLAIDLEQLEDGAEAWWKSLTPGQRGVYLQATWECEGEPEPRRKPPQQQETTS